MAMPQPSVEEDLGVDLVLEDTTAADPMTACVLAFTNIEKLQDKADKSTTLTMPQRIRLYKALSVMESTLDLQLRCMHIKIRIEQAALATDERVKHELNAAILAANEKDGPFQPGTDEYESLLRTVKRIACRREILRIKAKKQDLSEALRGLDTKEHEWRKKMRHTNTQKVRHTDPRLILPIIVPERYNSMPVLTANTSAVRMSPPKPGPAGSHSHRFRNIPRTSSPLIKPVLHGPSSHRPKIIPRITIPPKQDLGVAQRGPSENVPKISSTPSQGVTGSQSNLLKNLPKTPGAGPEEPKSGDLLHWSEFLAQHDHKAPESTSTSKVKATRSTRVENHP